ncbi:MAG: rhodanese-like domain-containing protein [Pseudomonadota bacterium]
MKTIAPKDLKARLSEPAEIALVDVREFGRYGEGHPFLAVNIPYSRLEIEAAQRLPRKDAPIVLLDEGDGVADHAARRLAALGYSDLTTLEGGAPAWAAEGFTLFKGVNLPSKTFGELIEETRHTPHLSPEELRAMLEGAEPPLLLDGRTTAEHRRFTVPGSQSCPNGELGLRLPPAIAPGRTVVVHCAGRTRSIIGAETLRAMGLADRVFALENGTQGWELSGQSRETGADRLLSPHLTDAMRADAIARATAFCDRHRIPRIDAGTLRAWRDQPDRTLYLLDVRTREEFEQASIPGAAHAEAGQLVQATDHWLAVRGARVVVWDDCQIRAAFAAYWLRGMGWDAALLTGPTETATPEREPAETFGLARLDAAGLAGAAAEGARLIDVRPSAAYRAGHIVGAIWSIRPRLARLADLAGARMAVIGDDEGVAALAARELLDRGAAEVRFHLGDPDAWAGAGLEIVATPASPTDAERIDHLFFVANRHAGDLDQARAYLAWEKQLTAQIDDQERAVFRLEPAPA